jgi:cytochrome b561
MTEAIGTPATFAGREALQNRLHVAAVLLCAWLIGTSPWVSMLRRIPTDAGLLDYAHVVLGFAGLAVALAYTYACCRGGRWRLYFPWLAGDLRPAAGDFVGLLRGRLPSAEGGGLFAVIEGLLLLALLLVGISGAAWFLLQGSADAVAYRAVHVVSARVLAGLIVAHVLAVATHLLELA